MAASSAREFLVYKLRNTAAISALVNTRIYHGLIPEPATYPCINVQQIGGPTGVGPNAQRDHFQINCRYQGIDKAELCWDLAEEVIKAIFEYQGTTDSFDVQNIYVADSRQTIETSNVYVTIIDAYITYDRA